MIEKTYTTKLGAGQGLIDETRVLLDLWQPNMSAKELFEVALSSGQFPRMTARRIKNLVVEGFFPRYIIEENKPAIYLKILKNSIRVQEFNQILFVYTCRLHRVLYDFVREIYWNTYSSGQDVLTIYETREFIEQANSDGKTTSPWSEKVIVRVSSYLNGTCADFGLLEHRKSGTRKIKIIRIESLVFIYFAYELHISGLGDNQVISHPDWSLFGMDRSDVLNEFKRQSLKGWWIFQSAGEATRIGWKFESMQELINVFTE
jgi:hypothetical protein